MESSNVARFLVKHYIDSLDNEDKSTDPMLKKFKDLSEELKDNIHNTGLINHPETISSLYDLNDALVEWRFLKEQKKVLRGPILSCFDVSHIIDQSPINKLGEIIKKPSSTSNESSQLNLSLWDRYTFYKPADDDGFCDELKKIVDWLLTTSSSSDNKFMAVGIYGMGGSGKTALVKQVLSQKSVGEKFKRIIWACLAQLTCEEEIDVRIMEYFLYRLGLDIDGLLADDDNENQTGEEYKDWLVEKVESLLKSPSENYCSILVLDDMWLCSESFAKDFLGILKKNGGGRWAVVVTSRRKTVAEKIGDKNKIIHLMPKEKEHAHSS